MKKLLFLTLIIFFNNCGDNDRTSLKDYTQDLTIINETSENITIYYAYEKSLTITQKTLVIPQFNIGRINIQRYIFDGDLTVIFNKKIKVFDLSDDLEADTIIIKSDDFNDTF